jgi:metallo-beta-lactamase class B
MTRWLVLLVVCAAAARGESQGPPAWREPFEPFQLAGPIYYVGTRGLAVYLIKSNEGLILLGGAMPGSEELITASIRKLGFKLQDVRLLLVSHAHFDHVGTMAALKKATGAKLAVMDSDAALLASGGKTDYLFAKRPEFHFEGVTADRLLKDGETVTLGDVRLIAHKTPGHTPGCTTWETTIRLRGRSYKVVFADGTSINPGTRFLKNPSYPGIADDYARTFRVLGALRPDIFLSYHGEFFDLEGKRRKMEKEGAAAWIGPKGYAALVKTRREAFEELLRKERQ